MPGPVGRKVSIVIIILAIYMYLAAAILAMTWQTDMFKPGSTCPTHVVGEEAFHFLLPLVSHCVRISILQSLPRLTKFIADSFFIPPFLQGHKAQNLMLWLNHAWPFECTMYIDMCKFQLLRHSHFTLAQACDWNWLLLGHVQPSNGLSKPQMKE